MNKYGFIYVRHHISYDQFGAYKIGKTCNIVDRDVQYATGEIVRGKFIIVFEVELNLLDSIEKLLKYTFYKFNIRYDAGTEFYDKQISNLIEPCLIEHNIKYKILTGQEIEDLVRSNRQNNETNNNICPRDYQNDIIIKSVKHFQQNDKGLLVLTCGLGKTLLSLWISQCLNYKYILIGVPTLVLMYQWLKEINNVFLNIPCLTTNESIENIQQFLNNNNKCIII